MNATIKTFEQLQEEARAAQVALDEAKRKEVQAKRDAEVAERKAKEQRETDALAARLAPAINAVADALRAADVPCVAKPFAIIVGGTDPQRVPRDLQIYVYREEESSSAYSFRTRYTGRIILAVGQRCSNQRVARFPLKKDGMFSTEKIVAEITDRIKLAHRVADAAAEKQTAKRQADALAKRLNEQLGSQLVGSYWHRDAWNPNRSTERVAPQGRVFLRLDTMCVDEEQARVMLDAIARVHALQAKKKEI